ncbi:MAG: hypothetical protein GY711_25295 [bacterium]|nr:hypothetical protein [bacterium]
MDAYLGVLEGARLGDGSEVSCKRRGLELTLTVGERKGEALLRRQAHVVGPGGSVTGAVFTPY